MVRAARLSKGRHRTSMGRFLAKSSWDAPAVLTTLVLGILRWLRPRAGEWIWLVIDDTRIGKRARRMAAVKKIWDHVEKRFVRGHMVVTAAIVFRGITLPWRFHLWLPKEYWRSRGWRWMTIATINGRLKKIGDVRGVYSKRPGDPWKKMVAIVTNATTMPPRAIIANHERRWAIEVLFKELKGTFGLGDYPMQKRQGMEQHLHLCGLAHLALTHHALRAVGAQAKQANKDVPPPRFQERLDAMRREIREDNIERFVRRIRHAKIRRRVRQQLLAA